MNRRPRAAARRALPLFQEVDSYASTYADRITCRRGCTWCCFKFVDATLAEGTLIAAHVREVMPERERTIKAALARQLPIFETMRSAKGDEARYFERREPCAFLDVPSGDCTIYGVRPYSCRQHLSTGAPSRCSPIENPDGIVPFVDMRPHGARFFGALARETEDAIPMMVGPLQWMVLAGFELLDRTPRDFVRWATGRVVVYVDNAGTLGAAG